VDDQSNSMPIATQKLNLKLKLLIVSQTRNYSYFQSKSFKARNKEFREFWSVTFSSQSDLHEQVLLEVVLIFSNLAHSSYKFFFFLIFIQITKILDDVKDVSWFANFGNTCFSSQ
jgi:hypothetical protein